MGSWSAMFLDARIASMTFLSTMTRWMTTPLRVGSAALQRAANVKRINNAERDLHTLFRSLGLTLPLQISSKKPLNLYTIDVCHCLSLFVPLSVLIDPLEVWIGAHPFPELEALVRATSPEVLQAVAGRL